jgi:hypothetical protein
MRPPRFGAPQFSLTELHGNPPILFLDISQSLRVGAERRFAKIRFRLCCFLVLALILG